MLEILYNINSLIITAWNADASSQGNFHPGPDEAVVIFPIDPPTVPSDWYMVDLVNQVVLPNPDYDPHTPDYHRACEILSNPSIPIPAPDLADLVRIFGRRLGYDF